MVLLLHHKPIVNLCLCVRNIHLARVNDVLRHLDETPANVVSVYVFLGDLYHKRRVFQAFNRWYPHVHLAILDADEREIVSPSDAAPHLPVKKYAFVSIDGDLCIEKIRFDLIRTLYTSVHNLVTPSLSFISAFDSDASPNYHHTIAVYIEDGRCRSISPETAAPPSSCGPLQEDACTVERWCDESAEKWLLKVTDKGYLGAPNKNRRVYTYAISGAHTRFVEVAPGLYAYDDYLFDKSAFEIVVARYTESMEWAEKYQDVVTVYEKYDGGDAAREAVADNLVPCSRRERLPNVGREAHTYLHHIIKNYHCLAHNTLFTQCGFEEHDTYPIEEYMFYTESSRFLLNNFKTIYAKDGRYGFLQHKWKWLDDYNSGKLLPEKRTFKQWWTERLRKPLPHINRFKWSHGAIFSVSDHRIRTNALEDYKRMIECLSHHSNPEAGHYFERAWYFVFERE